MEVKKFIKPTLITITTVCFLNGCAAMYDDPYFKDRLTYPESVEFHDDDIELRLNYLARYMMESDNRNEIINEVSNSNLYKNWGAVEYSNLSSMAVDAHVGELNSTAGMALGTAVLVLGEIFDGSMEHVSNAFIPDEFNGVKIDTKEKAQAALYQFTAKRIEIAAEQRGMAATCIFGCNQANQIHELTPTKDTFKGYIYQPSDAIVVLVNIGDVEPVSDDDPISAILNENISWKTVSENGYRLAIFSEPFRDEKGNIEIHQLENGLTIPKARKDLIRTRVGRDFFKSYHSTPYTMMGNQDVYPHQFFFNGSLYSFISNSNTNLIEYELVETPLVTDMNASI